jgi:hypothetical protein
MNAIVMLALTAAVWTTDGTDSLAARPDRIDIAGVALRPGWFELAPALDERRAPSVAAVWRAVDDGRGNTWLGTGHGGGVYRVGRSGTEQVYEAEATEVMALVVGPDGAVYFGLTPGGDVYRVAPGGKPELFGKTAEGYVYDLAFGPDGALYAATGPAGRLYRLTAGGTRAVFTAPQLHLACLEPTAGGLLVGTAPDGIVYSLVLRGDAQPGVEVVFDTPLAEVRALAEDGSGGVFIAANPSNEGHDSARVYHVDAGRIERWSWACPDSNVFDIAYSDGRLLVATGSPPRLYELDGTGRASLLHRLDEGQFLSLEPEGRGWLAGLGNPGRLMALGNELADSGLVTSAPFDCGAPARFGRLDRVASVPNGSALDFDLRCGYSEKPDSTWTAWQPAAGFNPVGRYVQWRARLASRFPGVTPRVERVELYYSVPNRAPAISKLEVVGVSLDDARLGRPKPARDISFAADDPDGDSLEFRADFRARGETNWIALGDAAAEKHFELDTRGLADGWYEVRARASDRPTRGTAALEGELVSRPFLVDNTAPTVRDISVTRTGPGKARVRFRATDDLTPVSACRIAVNAGDWQAVDVGMADALNATLEADVGLPAGDWVVAVWAADAQGNTGAGRKTGR